MEKVNPSSFMILAPHNLMISKGTIRFELSSKTYDEVIIKGRNLEEVVQYLGTTKNYLDQGTG